MDVGNAVGVGVGEGVGVGVGVSVGVGVGVGVGVRVGTGVGVGVGVHVGSGVHVGAAVHVGAGAGTADSWVTAVGGAVGVGVGLTQDKPAAKSNAPQSAPMRCIRNSLNSLSLRQERVSRLRRRNAPVKQGGILQGPRRFRPPRAG